MCADASPDAPTAERDARARFVAAMRSVPGAIAIIATGQPGERSGLVATAWCSLSADPPTLLACVNQNASAHDRIVETGLFSINLLSPDHTEDVAIFSAKRDLAGDARFGAGTWLRGEFGQPILVGSIAAFECRLLHHYDHGSHSVLIGRVVRIACRGIKEGLIYVGGEFAIAAPLLQS